MKKILERQRKTKVDEVCYEVCLKLGKDAITLMAVVFFLKIISSNPITYVNAFPMIKQVLLLEIQVHYVQDINVTRETENLWMLMKKVVQVISEIGQPNYFVQAENQWN